MLTLLPDLSHRLSLRAAVRADGPVLAAANGAARDYHAPWSAPFADPEGAERWWARQVTGPDRAFVAHERATGALVAVVSLSGISVAGPLRSAWLGHHGYPGTAGRGLVADAVRLACRHGVADFGLGRIEANIQPGNHRSIRLARRLGFRHEGLSAAYLRIGGEARAHERWAILDREIDRPASDPPEAITDEAERFWRRFREASGIGPERCPATTRFGLGRAEGDALAALVRSGRKRATVSRAAEYGPGSAVLPAPGDLAVVLDGAGAPVAVIRTTAVRLGPLGSVSDAFAWDEGEADRTRATWLATHHAFYAARGVAVSDTTELVFERFAAIWPDR